MTRHESREQAFTLLFEISFHPQTELEDIIALGLENDFLEDDGFSFLLARAAWDKLFEIDELIEKYSVGWKKNRISKVSLAALRLAIGEMRYIDDIPVSVSINEAIEICKKYASEDEYAFVNGVLGSVAKALAEDNA